MRTVNFWLPACIAAFMAAALGAAANAADSEPYRLRLKWKAGQVITYRFAIRSEITAQEATLTTQVDFDVTLKVEEEGSPGSALVPGKPMQVALTYGDIKLTRESARRTLTVGVSAKELDASVNGRPMQDEQKKYLAKSLSPLQALLTATLKMHLLDTGKIVEVKGLELIAEQQHERLISSLKASFALPRQPLRVGDTFTDQRSLGIVLPRLTAASQEEEQKEKTDDTIEIPRTLTSVTSDPESGRSIQIAVLSGALHWSSSKNEKEKEKGKENARAFPRLFWKDHAIDADVDLKYETGFDIDRGVHTYDTVTGVITLEAKNLNTGPVEVRVNYQMKLIRYE